MPDGLPVADGTANDPEAVTERDVEEVAEGSFTPRLLRLRHPSILVSLVCSGFDP